MAIKIGINGFGRIGRIALRQALEIPEQFEVCAINYRNVDLEHMVYMMRYDSTFGRYGKKIIAKDNGLQFDDIFVPVFEGDSADTLPWGKTGAEYIVCLLYTSN